MKAENRGPNLFVVDTPHQLLNAIEAIHALQLANNHLLVTRPRSGAQDKFAPLIKTERWATVSFPSVWIKPRHSIQKLLGPVGNRWYCRCLHLLQMLALAKVAFRFPHVDKLFLGHYSAEWTPFMRHIANSISYKTLYLLDDGTDTIEINNRRHQTESNKSESATTVRSPQSSVWKITAHLRKKCWNWKLEEAPQVTFFTIYDINVRKGDQLIRNSYHYLQALRPPRRIDLPNTVIFLGICSSDNYIEMKTYLDCLSKIQRHFTGIEFMYVPHPRDSASFVTRIKEHLQCGLWQSCSVIEYDLVNRGLKPKAVTGFVSSALVTLAHLLDADVDIVCFHLAPEHWIHWGKDADQVCGYMREKVQRVRILPLRLSEETSEEYRYDETIA